MGWPKTARKLIVFESDDWGSNRISSNEALRALIKENILPATPSHYDRYDTIARAKDLQMLFEVLSSVKDKHGHNAVFTPFVNPSNPDFEKIRESDFKKYYPEIFTDTLAKSGEKEEVLKLWQEGLNENLLVPAFHGREHLCVPLWMEQLQNKDSIVRQAFDHHFYSVPLNTLPAFMGAFRPALFYANETQIAQLKESVSNGIQQMKNIFGVEPTVFCPPNGISHSIFDEVSVKAGIKSIMTNRFRSEPDGKGGLKSKYYGYGQKNEWGQKYYYRNTMFEPTYSDNSVDFCMMQIEAAFRWWKPAIISTHRVNYMGSLNPENREKGLSQLKVLLKRIVDKWPDAEFISSNDFSDILHKNNRP
jgi:hypothetical protein